MDGARKDNFPIHANLPFVKFVVRTRHINTRAVLADGNAVHGGAAAGVFKRLGDFPMAGIDHNEASGILDENSSAVGRSRQIDGAALFRV